ncbi:MAG: Fe-S-containing hydro-lyase [Thermincola sp.]|jgi:fumarate hydratase subunit beta|nr:Fe-S-containing hydro-lyase [Thermincola sp.]MDT3704244.1 Fe-S-containing hydro-lyase [Thermincola sp.]
MAEYKIKTPLTPEIINKLKAGDLVQITGQILTARDAAHKKLIELLEIGEKLPVNIEGQIIYYVGPSPAKPGAVIGSAGPTTSGRIDAYTPTLIGLGLRGMIGKGSRTTEVKEAMKMHGAVYFAAVGGAAALIAKTIKKAEIIAYPELGPEAVHLLEVEDLPVVVVNDVHGGDLYQEGKEKYKRI